MPALKEELGKRNPFASPEEEAYLNLLRTIAVLEAPFSRLLKGKGLSEAAYNILRICRGHSMAEGTSPHGIPCQTIGDQLVSRLPDVTRLVDRLEEAGLVKRARTPDDRRVVLVGITRKGLAILAELDKPIGDLHKQTLRHMTRPELTELNRLLAKARTPEA
jgi:DNA-binding MarR family transcriptional regulator